MIDKNSLESLRVFLEDDFLYSVKKLLTNKHKKTNLDYDRIGLILNEVIQNFAKNNCNEKIKSAFKITY